MVMKNWEPLVPGPALAMDSVKGRSCRRFLHRVWEKVARQGDPRHPAGSVKLPFHCHQVTYHPPTHPSNHTRPTIPHTYPPTHLLIGNWPPHHYHHRHPPHHNHTCLFTQRPQTSTHPSTHPTNVHPHPSTHPPADFVGELAAPDRLASSPVACSNKRWWCAEGERPAKAGASGCSVAAPNPKPKLPAWVVGAGQPRGTPRHAAPAAMQPGSHAAPAGAGRKKSGRRKGRGRTETNHGLVKMHTRVCYLLLPSENKIRTHPGGLPSAA